MDGFRSEGGLEGQADEAAVLQEGCQAVLGRNGGTVIAVTAHEVNVFQVKAVLLLNISRHPDAVVAEPLVAAENSGGVTVEADRVGQRRRQVDTVEHLIPGGCECCTHTGIVLGGAAVPLVEAASAACRGVSQAGRKAF